LLIPEKMQLIGIWKMGSYQCSKTNSFLSPYFFPLEWNRKYAWHLGSNNNKTIKAYIKYKL